MKQATKYIMIIALLTGFAVNANAQNAVKTSTPDGAKSKAQGSDNWAELKDFHSVMAATFHPAEEGNLKPIRERSGEMATKAKLLAGSKIPAEFDKPEMKKAVQELMTGTADLDIMIKNKATDKEITAHLSGLHDTFHKIVGLCQPGDQHEGHDHSDPNHKH